MLQNITCTCFGAPEKGVNLTVYIQCWGVLQHVMIPGVRCKKKRDSVAIKWDRDKGMQRKTLRPDKQERLCLRRTLSYYSLPGSPFWTIPRRSLWRSAYSKMQADLPVFTHQRCIESPDRFCGVALPTKRPRLAKTPRTPLPARPLPARHLRQCIRSLDP